MILKKFLDSIDYNVKQLKEIMIQGLLEIELKTCLLEKINDEIINNNISIDNQELQLKVNQFHDYSISVNGKNSNNLTDEEINSNMKKYMEKINELINMYIEIIIKDANVEIL